jgi:hypothetical protein
MDVQLLRYILFNGIEEVAELPGAVALPGLADDLARTRIGEQAGGAVALVVVGAALDLSWAHGQQRRGATESLNLTLLVHAQHQRTVRRIEIQAHNVAHLVEEQRVAAELERLLSTLVFTVAIFVLTSILVGLAPAIQASHTDLKLALKEGGRRTTTASSSSARHWLAISEIALAMALLVGDGLMINTVLRLQHTDPGFDPKDATTMQVNCRREESM